MRKLISSRAKFGILLLSALLLLSACERNTTYDDFTTCLADSGAEFYGAFWCPHCSDQKKLFGDSTELLPYIECDVNGKNSQAQLCKEENIESYPTWKFPDGTVKNGVVSLTELGELTSCPLPGEESLMEE